MSRDPVRELFEYEMSLSPVSSLAKNVLAYMQRTTAAGTEWASGLDGAA